MAKTKLISKLIDTMVQVENTLKQINATMNAGKYVDPDAAKKSLDKDFAAVDAAVAALETHFKNLHRREESPNALDRIRNMKNIFKDKAALSAHRSASEDLLIHKAKPDIATSKHQADKLILDLRNFKAQFWDAYHASQAAGSGS